jgi:hypothetical protein
MKLQIKVDENGIISDVYVSLARLARLVLSHADFHFYPPRTSQQVQDLRCASSLTPRHSRVSSTFRSYPPSLALMFIRLRICHCLLLFHHRVRQGYVPRRRRQGQEHRDRKGALSSSRQAALLHVGRGRYQGSYSLHFIRLLMTSGADLPSVCVFVCPERD